MCTTHARSLHEPPPQPARRGPMTCGLLSAILLLYPYWFGLAQTRQPRPTVTLTIPEAVQMAVDHNRKLQLTRLEIAGAKEKKAVAKSDYYPHIRNESAALHLTALEGVVIPAGAFSNAAAGPIPGQTIRLGQGAADSFTSGTGLTQPITQLLKVHAGVRAADADVHIANIDALDAEDQIALLVHKLYFEMLTRQMQIDAADASVKAALVAQEESTQAIAEGKSLEVAKLENRAAVLQQRQASLTDQLALEDLAMQFDDVLGLPLGTKLQLDPDALGEDKALPSEEDAVLLLQEHNPKVLSARQAMEKARAALTAAKDAYIPDITGLARYSYQSGVPFLVHNFGTFGGAVSYELFDGGARQARLKLAKIRLHEAELQLAQTEADVSVQISALYDDIQKLQQLVAVVSENLLVVQEQARIAQQRLQQSSALASEVSRSQASVAVARSSALEARLDLVLLQKQVLTLLGERPN